MKPKLVLFGAGNIGRSFIGALFARGGYEVVFVDINARVIEALNRRGAYEVVVAHPDGNESRVTVEGVRGVDANDRGRVAEEVVDAALAATAVGAAALPAVAALIGEGVALRRARRPGAPLDVILAENVHDAAGVVAAVLAEGPEGEANLDAVGLVETSIGKMVPIVPREVAENDPLLVFAEPYNTLIVDAKGFRAETPRLPDIRAVDSIRAYVERKLFVHNLGHAAVAYVGNWLEPTVGLIADAVALAPIRQAAEAAMTVSVDALAAAYPDALEHDELLANRDELLDRFANRALADTVYRVGRDLPRKLARDDRIVGAMRLAVVHGIDFTPIARVYRAALEFSATDEAGEPFPADAAVVELARRQGTLAVLQRVSGLDRSNETDARIIDAVLTLPDAERRA